MRYLKRYKEINEKLQINNFLDPAIEKDLEDICLELEDDGFEYVIDNKQFVFGFGIDRFESDHSISIHKQGRSIDYASIRDYFADDSEDAHLPDRLIIQPEFHFSKVLDVVERIKDFLTINGYIYRVSESNKPNVRTEKGYVEEISIYFKKD